MSIREKVADLLDILADTYEVPATSEVHQPSVEKFAASYHEATGEELDEDTAAQFRANPALQDALLKVAAQRSKAPTPLGEPVGRDSDERSNSKHATERDAYDRFAQNILALGR